VDGEMEGMKKRALVAHFMILLRYLGEGNWEGDMLLNEAPCHEED
jgi:hypothetical protein